MADSSSFLIKHIIDKKIIENIMCLYTAEYLFSKTFIGPTLYVVMSIDNVIGMFIIASAEIIK